MQRPFSAALKLADRQSRRKTIISLTPLIDVVFILLVFFMLASSFMDWRSLALDTSAAGQPAPSEQTPFVVQVSAKELRLNGEVITPAVLIDTAQSRQPATQPVVLQPVAETQVQALIKVLDALQAAGVQPLKLADDPEWQADASDQAGGDN